MTSLKKRKPCAKCSIGKAVATCNGCQQTFCINHFSEHRDELSNSMDIISIEHDSLRSDLFQENFEHPLLSRIDNWERESIKKIQDAAQIARTKLQQVLIQKKVEIKSIIENFTIELQHSRESADYTENEINNWTEKLKTLRKALTDWSTIILEDDDHPESIIHLIKISDPRNEESLSIVQSSESIVHIPEESLACSNEKFDPIDMELVLSEDNLVATYRSKLNIFSNRFVYGINRYQSGKHYTRFSIDKKGESPLFFGIITASKKYDQSFFAPNNSSVYGWYNIESLVISGKSQGYKDDNVLATGDELILIVDCDKLQIFLQHQKTKRLFPILINLEKCPFPWKLIIGLSNFNDCIRIIN